MEATFTIALKLCNVSYMEEKFLSVSDPTSKEYGKYLSIDSIIKNFGPSAIEREEVIKFFQTINGAKVESNLHGDMIRVTAKVSHIESTLNTEIRCHTHQIFPEAKALRATQPIVIPEKISKLLSFVSLNIPIGNLKWQLNEDTENKLIQTTNSTLSVIFFEY